MTVATTNITSGPYTGTGAGDEFAYDFRVDNKTQLSVWETDDVGVKTLLVVDTDYTVAGVGVDGGGQITRVAGNLPTDYIWYIRSNYADTQSTAFGSQGGFFSDVHEKEFDKRTFVSQQQEDLFRRAIKLDNSDESVETADLTIPVVATRASQYLGFDASGDLITIAGTAGAVTVSSFMETLLDDNDIETALGTLGLSKGADAASAGTLALGDGRYFDVTGATAITSIGAKFIGAISILHFTGSLVFTHHATNLINVGGVDITTEAGDHVIMFEYDTGKSVMIGYFRASSLPALLSAANTFSGVNTFSGDNAHSGTNTFSGPSNTFDNNIIASGGVKTDGTNTLKTKIVDIGDWDMNTTTGDGVASVTVAHGLTFGNIRSMDVLINVDGSSAIYPLTRIFNTTTATVQGSIATVDNTNVTLYRLTGGLFDSINFDDTSFNRGWITITYIA